MLLKKKFTLHDNSNVLRILGFATYLFFVWSLAYIKKDYIWFPGDAANLLQQSLLLSKGFLPNIDFFSGYPGLDLQINSAILIFMGGNIASQQIYMALTASALGLVFFWSFSKVEPWLITLFLLFIYSQGLYPNPAPNPGYLCIVFFVIGLKKTIDFFNGYSFIDSMVAGFFFSLAFLSKQYGLFGPICFFIATTSFINCRTRYGRFIFPFGLIAVFALVIYFYVQGLWLNQDTHEAVMLNTIVFSVPLITSLVAYFIGPKMTEYAPISVQRALLANFILVGTFVLTCALYLIGFYGIDALFEAVNQFMFQAPSRINKLIIPVSYSFSGTIVILLALPFFILPFIFNADYALSFITKMSFANALIMCCGLLLIFQLESLHMTVFVATAYIALIVMVMINKREKHRRLLYSVISGIAPYMLLLVPWPNPAYHIPLLVFFVLSALQLFRSDTNLVGISNERAVTPYLMVSVLIYCLVVVYPHNIVNNKLMQFSFGDLNFISGVVNKIAWNNSINEAKLVVQGVGACTNYGCRFLVFSTQWKQDYLGVIEKP